MRRRGPFLVLAAVLLVGLTLMIWGFWAPRCPHPCDPTTLPPGTFCPLVACDDNTPLRISAIAFGQLFAMVGVILVWGVRHPSN